MAGSPKAPCGTFEAYKRHKRNKESVDPACQQAQIDHHMFGHEKQGAKLNEALQNTEDIADLSALDDARANLKIVTVAMEQAPPSSIAMLSKRRQELVDFIVKMDTEKEKNLDDLLNDKSKSWATDSEN